MKLTNPPTNLSSGRPIRPLFMTGIALFLTVSACNSLPLTPVVITATPDPRIIQITITNTPMTPTLDPRAGAFATLTAVAGVPVGQPPTTQIASAPTTEANTPGSIPTAAQTLAIQSQVTQITAVPTSVRATAAPGASPTTNPFPPDTRMQVFIAQEDFQGGYLFWIQTTGNFWVLLPATLPKKDDPKTVPSSGQWRIYKDTYKDTEPETDPSFVPPAGNLFQPKRGFGKLWRETPELRDALGWATTPEFALNTSYIYQPGGTVNDKGEYVPGPGKHILVSLGRNTFEFKEPAPGETFGTWKKVG